MLTIYTIKTNNAYYISNNIGGEYNSVRLIKYLFDGETPQPTFKNNWLKIKSMPKRVYYLEPQPNINFRYVIKDEVSEEVRNNVLKNKSYLREDVCTWDDDDYVWEVTDDDFKLISSFYYLTSDKQPLIEKDLDFEIVEVLAINEFNDSIKYNSYEVLKDPNWNHQGVKNVSLESFINNHELDKILNPNLVLKDLPCFISGDDLYEIVRHHIKINIDNKVAFVSSDYRFCFTVKKRISFEEPIITKKEILTKANKSYVKPKFQTITKTHREEVIFEMTAPKDKYKGYPVLDGIRANSHEELQNDLDRYLKDLMAYINEPVKECSHCKGAGVLFNNNFKLNDSNEK